MNNNDNYNYKKTTITTFNFHLVTHPPQFYVHIIILWHISHPYFQFRFLCALCILVYVKHFVYSLAIRDTRRIQNKNIHQYTTHP